MKFPLPSLALALTIACTVPGLAQDDEETSTGLKAASEVYTFDGKIAFHQRDGDVFYELTISKGQVSGVQHMRDNNQPIARIVGGWFDAGKGRLSVLVQGADTTQARYRSQMQQFQLNVKAKTATLEHMLYDYGLTAENPDIPVAHVLDTFEKVESPAASDKP